MTETPRPTGRDEWMVVLFLAGGPCFYIILSLIVGLLLGPAPVTR